MQNSKTEIFQKFVVGLLVLIVLVCLVLIFSTETIEVKRIPLLIGLVLIILVLGTILFFTGLNIYKRKLFQKISGSVNFISNGEFEKQNAFIQNNFSGKFKEVLMLMNENVQSHYQSIEERLVDRSARISLQNEKLRQKQKEIQIRNKELHSAYEALRESRQKYEKLIVNLEDEYFFFSYSISGEVLFVSPSISKILGFTTNEYRGKFHKLFTDNPMNVDAKNSIQNSLKGIQQPMYLMELYNSKNNPHIFEVSEVPVYNDKGNLVSIEGLAHDITKRLKSAELIKEQEEKYRGVFNYASDFVFLYELLPKGKMGKFVEANKYTLDTLGYSEDELYSKSPMNLTVIPADFSDDIHPMKEKYERIWESREGIFITVEISEHKIQLKGKEHIIAVARDITERKKAVEEIRFMNEELINQKENLEALVDNLTQTQEQLVQSEKMAALGQLIAGVAHEINTPLGAIKASIGNL
ncbi:MAG: PAS domain S-box protein, partial [Bacteroidales bacterium]|nr:PAS domain S-box protein [Bacteroidales bacterium]